MFGPMPDIGGTPPSQQQALATLQLQLRKTEKRVEQLLLVVHGMFRLLAEKTSCTEAELQEKLLQIGQEAREKVPDECSQCGREIKSSALKCMYCGEGRPVRSVFEMM